MLLVEHVIIEFIAAVDLDSADLPASLPLKQKQKSIRNN